MSPSNSKLWTSSLGISILLCICFVKIDSSTEALQCGPNEHNLDGKQCCTKCPVGQGMRNPCNETSDTECEPCIFGESFSGDLSHTQKCKQCSICPEYSYIKRVCNSTHNTVCQCDQNYFYDRISKRCRHCDLCPEGFGVRKQCTSTENTVCVACAPGTYSEFRSKERCKQCQMCRANQVMLNLCTATQNTVCIDIPESLGTVGPDLVGLGGGAAGTAAPPVEETHKKLDVIPIYCSVLGLLVLALLVCAIVRHRKQRQKLLQARKAELALRNGSPSKDGISAATGFDGRLTRGQTSVADSGVYMEPECRPVTSMSLVRDIPPVRGKVLETMLQGGRDGQSWWSRLARDLGYNTSQIASIEIRSQHEGQTALRFLLSDYGRQDTAIVGHLVDSLRNIGREDCVQALYGELRDYAPAPRYIDLGSLQGQII